MQMMRDIKIWVKDAAIQYIRQDKQVTVSSGLLSKTLPDDNLYRCPSRRKELKKIITNRTC